MKVIYLLCLLGIFFTSQVQSQHQEHTFRHLTNDQGLSQNTVPTILKDKRGFMWFGTRDGLNKYDGSSFTVYRNDAHDSTSLSSSIIIDLLEDKQGDLWIATPRGMDKFNRKSNTFSHYTPDKAPIFVQDLFEDRQGTIWLSTRNGLYQFNPATATFFSYRYTEGDSTGLLHTNMVNKVVQDAQDNLWIATGVGLECFNRKKNTFTYYQNNPTDPKSLASNSIKSIFVDSKNNLWLGTGGKGLDLYDRDTHSFIHFQYDPTNNRSLSNDYVLCFNQGNDGKLWVGTENGGINIYEETTRSFTRYQYDIINPASLNSNSVRCIYKDNIGNIWVGTWTGGVNFVPKFKEKFAHYEPIPGATNSMNNKTIKTLYEDQDRKVWIGTDGGGVNVLDRTTNLFTHFRYQADQKGLASDHTHRIAPIGTDTLAIGYHNEGFDLLSRKTGNVTHFMLKENPLSSLFVGTILCVYTDHRGNVWLGTSGGGLYLFNRTTRTFTAYEANLNDPQTISSNIIYSLVEDKDRNLWVGTDNGLNRLDAKTGKFTRYQYDTNNPRSLSNNNVNSVLQDKKGRIWVATSGGLNLWNQATNAFTAYTEEHGLANNVIYGILEDRHGNLWLSSNKGIIRFNPNTTSSRNYTIADGVQGNEFIRGAYYQNAQGEMFFGGVNGFNIFHPDSLQDNPFVPPVVLTDLQIFNKSVAIGKDSPLPMALGETKEITLSYQQSVFTLTYAALNFNQSENNQYAYQLQGFDKDWNYVGTKHSATYTNLDPGEYYFRVKGSNNDGIWNTKGTSIKIIITPPYWQTWWFRTLTAIVIIGSIITFYLARMKAAKVRQEELEKQVRERTVEIVSQKEELVCQAENLQSLVAELQDSQEELMQQQEELEAQAELLQQTNSELKDTQDKISEQRDHLEQINNQMVSSIKYAYTIQQAILPSASSLRTTFKEHFILYRPKDVVSGDFYWFSHIPKEELEHQENDLTFVAAIDCTGHGVPGAFMSIIGNTMLNEIVNQKHILDPSQILEELDKGMRRAVAKSEGVNTAGMDVCLCRLQRGEGGQVNVVFAGAKRPLLVVRKDTTQIEVLEGTRRSIGGDSQIERSFATQELILEKGATMYLYTDGYTDQNNPQRIKLGNSRLKERIKQVVMLPLAEQKIAFEQTLDTYQQDAEQRDDITLIGVQI